MDNETQAALESVLIGVQELGPAKVTSAPDVEVLSLADRLNLPVDAIAVVKYLAEHGPEYNEMEDNAWNTAHGTEDGNDPNEPADDTICPYDICSGYMSELESHEPTCLYMVAIALLGQWRNI